MYSEDRPDVYDPQEWGLSAQWAGQLAERLHEFWQRYRPCFKTRTDDGSPHALTRLKGMLLMVSARNYANNARRINGIHDSGQNLQHFMSNSPWSWRAVIEQLQEEIQQTPEFSHGSALLLDESADEKAGEYSAGAAKQYNGRLGKVEMSQVGVFLGYLNNKIWSWIDGELFLPEHWFLKHMQESREKAGIPESLCFATKPRLGWKMIQRAVEIGIPFEVVLMDNVYGHDQKLRSQLDKASLCYVADVASNTLVYLEEPIYGVPEKMPGRRGRKPTVARVLNGVEPIQVHQLVEHPSLEFRDFELRFYERGLLVERAVVLDVWTIRAGSVASERLLIRYDRTEAKWSYSLSNASAELHDDSQIVYWRAQRYFIERCNQDAKSELGFDEFEARKWLAWQHHMALTCLASWFLATLKLEWLTQYAPGEQLASAFELEELPALSMSNLRELLKSVMPLPRLSPEEAIVLVAQHLVNRASSTRSRRRDQREEKLARAPP